MAAHPFNLRAYRQAVLKAQRELSALMPTATAYRLGSSLRRAQDALHDHYIDVLEKEGSI